MKKRKEDLIIEAARYKLNGQLEFVRAFERRGTTYSDCVLITRTELLEQLLKGKNVATGQRTHLMASTFTNVKPVRIAPSRNRFVITSGSLGVFQDELADTPIL